MEDIDVGELLCEVAEHLDGFSPLVRQGHPAYLLGPRGARLVIHPLFNQARRIRVTGLYPDGGMGHSLKLPQHAITVATMWGAEHIAKKIARRLLPHYLRDLEVCRTGRKAHWLVSTARDNLAGALLGMLPGATVSESEKATVIRWRVGSMSGLFELPGDAMRNVIEVNDADRELTERIAYAIQHRSS